MFSMFNKLREGPVFQTGNGTRCLASIWVGSKKLGSIQRLTTVATCWPSGLGRDTESYFTALSSLNASTKPDPETIFNLSLQLAFTHLSNLSSSFKSFNDL